LYEKIVAANENNDLPTVMLIFGRSVFIMFDFEPIEDAILETNQQFELSRTYGMLYTLANYWQKAANGELQNNVLYAQPESYE